MNPRRPSSHHSARSGSTHPPLLLPSASTPALPPYHRLLFPLSPAPPPPPFPSCPQLTGPVYTLLALLLKQHISPWYSQLSPRDRTFLPHVARTVTHVLSSLDARLQMADTSRFVFHTLPVLLEHHYATYRAAVLRASFASSPTPLSSHYAALSPHPALDASSPHINPAYLRAATEHVLRALLPQEDWNAQTERVIVREVVVGPVLGGGLGRVCEPGVLWGILLAVLGRPKGQETPESILTPSPLPPTPPLVSLISSLRALALLLSSALTLLQSFLHLVSHLPASSSPPSVPYAAPGLALLLALLSYPPRLLPALVGSYAKLLVAASTPLSDRLLPHLLFSAFTPSNLTLIVTRITDLLYPRGQPAQPTPLPSPSETALLRTALEQRILALLPPLLLGPTLETREGTVHAALEPLSDPRCNAYLLMRLLDAVLLVVFPELAAGGEGKTIGEVVDSTPSGGSGSGTPE